MKNPLDRTTGALAVGSLLLLAESAFAHPGHGGSGFPAGIAHPLSGVDHLAAMLAVGLWAAQLGRRAVWLVPTAFIAMMIAGAGLAFTGLHIPFVEQGIAASVLIMGLLLVFAFRMPTWAGMTLVGLFAVFHGYAHGSEMQPTASALAFATGFVISTVILHAAGIAIGLGLAQFKQTAWIRVAGLSLVGCAALLFAGVL
jgi:urease accessory protein